MRGEIPGASPLTIPMHHKIVLVEVEHADDSSEGSGGSKVQVMQPEPHLGDALIFR
jgi:hypothetical protein